jgi:multidrug transporter EmrE-like cation transporter
MLYSGSIRPDTARRTETSTMSTPLSSIVLFLLAAVLGALGQFLYKGGADAAQGGLLSYLTNVRILLGIVCYCAVMFLFVAAFKRGGSLAVLYPVYASTFIFAALISAAAFGTPIKPINVAGMLLLVGGMYCMGR